MIKGSDIGISLTQLIGSFTNINDLLNHWNNKVREMNTQLRKEGVLDPDEHTGYSAMNDKVQCLVFLARRCLSIAELKQKIKTIFSDEIEGIMLSTIHKAKGLEANRVFIIKPELIPHPKAKGVEWLNQERNLEYIAITRARHDLIYDREWKEKSKQRF